MATISDNDDWAKAVPLSRIKLKQRAHRLFDPLWQSRLVTRTEAYYLLAAELGVPVVQAHMTVMSRENLEKVPAAVKAIRAQVKLERKRK